MHGRQSLAITGLSAGLRFVSSLSKVHCLSTYRRSLCAIPRLHISQLHTSRRLCKVAGNTWRTPGMRFPIPSLPPKPSYPPPLIGEEAMDPYIIPLYLRSWAIHPQLIHKDLYFHTWSSFSRVYDMNDLATALDFFRDIVAITNKENVRMCDLIIINISCDANHAFFHILAPSICTLYRWNYCTCPRKYFCSTKQRGNHI